LYIDLKFIDLRPFESRNRYSMNGYFDNTSSGKRKYIPTCLLYFIVGVIDVSDGIRVTQCTFCHDFIVFGLVETLQRLYNIRAVPSHFLS
jgi:hypothetical protein